jgi:biopolymer transport protein ExbD
MKIKKIESINVIPFIDIMLVLLAIVLTTATFIAKGSIKIDLPQASSQAQKFEKPLELTLTVKGELFLDDKKISIEKLNDALSNISKKTTIIINGDKNMNYKYFVSVIDKLTLGGYTNLSIATLKD